MPTYMYMHHILLLLDYWEIIKDNNNFNNKVRYECILNFNSNFQKVNKLLKEEN